MSTIEEDDDDDGDDDDDDDDDGSISISSRTTSKCGGDTCAVPITDSDEQRGDDIPGQCRRKSSAL